MEAAPVCRAVLFAVLGIVRAGRFRMTSSRSNERERAAWPAWAALGVALASWELFLRIDSQTLATITKLWFLPLLAVTIVAAVTTLGAAVDQIVGRALPAAARRPVELIALSTAAAALFAAEYLGVTHYHAPELSPAWPLLAASGVVYAMIAFGFTPRLARPLPPLTEAVGAGRTAVVVLPIVIALTAASASVLLRADAAACILRPNTVLGRVAGWPLSRLGRVPEVRSAATLALPDLPATRAARRTDVVLVSVDTLRADALASYNPQARSNPALDRLAARSVVFEDAYVQRSTSAPSMASILTGNYPARHTVRQNAMILPDEADTLAERYRHAGFATAGFVTNINFDRAFNFQQGFDAYAFFDAETDEDGLMTDSSDGAAVDAALAWAAADKAGPSFLWVHLMAPHSPYVPPIDLRPELRPGRGAWFNVLNMPFALARVAGLETYFDREIYRELYAAEVTATDRQVARLIDGLERLDILDAAHLVFISDHGETFGEGDTFGHGHSLTRAEAHVPLMWKLPHDRRGGARIAMTMQAADIVPSLLTLTGLRSGNDDGPFDGRDVSGVLVGERPQDAGFAFSEAGYVDTLGARGLKYAARTRDRAIWLDTGFPYVSGFDRRRDPGETRPRRLATDDEEPLMATLTTLVAEAEKQRASGGVRAELDAAQQERLRALGYMH
jgi:arylsulfatase A-like enzyme